MDLRHYSAAGFSMDVVDYYSATKKNKRLKTVTVMNYTPRYIIYTAVCAYLDKGTKEKLDTALGKSEKITDASFIKVIGQHFDFRRMRDSPRVREDVWLFNYLMYENTRKDNFHITDIGNRIAFKGRLLRKGLIVQYEKTMFAGT